MMQFLWRYVDELVGKGLEMSVMAQFFFYSALSLVPLSLPLAVLLASLITFGNFGERYELLAMKAAGISFLYHLWNFLLFSERDRSHSARKIGNVADFYETEISGGGYTGRGVLFGNSRL